MIKGTQTSNLDSSHVCILDRHAWYQPTIESKALARVGATIEVSWAKQANQPDQVLAGRIDDPVQCEFMSRITSAFVPPSITNEQRVIEMAQNADGILVVRADITARVMDALPRLKVVGRYGIGLDNIDTEAAAQRGIAVVYAPGFCAREVADHTLSMLLACSRKLFKLNSAMHNNYWARDTASPMSALYSQTMGLIGFGQIGRETARRALAFGLRIIVHDPILNVEEAKNANVELVSMERLLSESDFISIHAPLNSQTHHLISSAQFALMKQTAYLINTSRGPHIDEVALVKALQAGKIAGAALDVFEKEPLPSTSALLDFDNVILTPHVAGLSDESQMELRNTVATAMADVLSGTWPKGPELFSPLDDIGRARTTARLQHGPI